jgi:hypothetical protein
MTANSESMTLAISLSLVKATSCEQIDNFTWTLGSDPQSDQKFHRVKQEAVRTARTAELGLNGAKLRTKKKGSGIVRI